MIIEGQLGRFFGCAPLACLFGWLVVFLLVWLGLVWADWFVLAFACLLCVVWVSFVCLLDCIVSLGLVVLFCCHACLTVSLFGWLGWFGLIGVFCFFVLVLYC